jgi:hypothetical protein
MYKKKLTKLFTLLQLGLCAVEIKIDQEALHKLCDGVAVSIVLLLNNAYKILEHIASARVGDDCSGEVTEDVRAICLDSLKVALREEQIDHLAAAVTAR